MFEVGFAELFVLGVIALLVVGPDKLPGLARTVGVWVGKAQRLVGQVRADIEREVRADELRKAAKEYSPTNVLSDVKKEVEDFAGDVSKPLDLDEEATGPTKPGAGDAEPAGGSATAAPRNVPEPPTAAAAADEDGAAGSGTDEPSAGDDSGSEPAAAASDAGNGPDVQPAETPEADQSADPPTADSTDVERVNPAASDAGAAGPVDAGSATPKVGEGERSNGREQDVVPSPVTQSATTPPAERDERTAAT